MKLKLIALASLAALSLPLASYAGGVTIHINNKTDSYGTGKVNISPCSSNANNGVIQPHESDYKVSGDIFNFCMFGKCDAHVYLSKNCSGHEIATAKLDSKDGVVCGSIHNKDEEHYKITGCGTHVAIEPVKNTLGDWFKSWF